MAQNGAFRKSGGTLFWGVPFKGILFYVGYKKGYPYFGKYPKELRLEAPPELRKGIGFRV